MAADRGSFTERVRQELSRAPLPPPPAANLELAALLHLAGALHLRGTVDDDDRLSVRLETTSAAVARRVFLLVQELYELRPTLAHRRAGGVRERASYAVTVGSDGALAVAEGTGLLDGDGRPTRTLPAPTAPSRDVAVAGSRGAFLASGSVSRPGRAPHLEVRVPNGDLAVQLAGWMSAVSKGNVTAHPGTPTRVVAKSGETIGALLAAMGSTNAFLAWDEHRLRRSLRNEANRLANADAANLRRTIESAAGQTAAVELVLERVGLNALDDELRAVALARIANPTASLTELSSLCDPPLSKSAVHRRLRRLEQIATELD